MSYEPNYCPHCGEKIERTGRKYLTSWFCENCESSFKKEDWLPRLWLILSGLAFLLGFGSYLKTPEKPLNLTTNQFALVTSNKNSGQKNEQISVNSTAQNSVNKTNVQTDSALQNQSKLETSPKNAAQIETKSPQIIESEPVYFCGAQTKKGTPCTRKVKGGGRCWQHTGLPAMLPKEKLIFSQ